MKNDKTDEKNWSVLNTDIFDRRRFKEIFDMSEGLQKLSQKAILPLYESLLSDIWASFYKMKPVITVKGDDGLLVVNKYLMQVIMTDKNYRYHRNFTRLNDLASVVSTLQFGEKINHWLAELQEKDKELREQLLKTQLRLGHMRKSQLQEADEKSEAANMKELKEKLQRKILGNDEAYGQVMNEASQESKRVEGDLKSLLGGLNAGNFDAELKKVPLRDKILLAEKIASTKQMKEIADWAGRFKQTARRKQKAKQSECVTRRGITRGNDLENLLPVELSYYTHPLMKMDFLRRFAEGETMQYEQKGSMYLKKGPIILCLDQSDSMRSLETQSKGFTLALMSIAKKQQRDLCLVLFSSSIQIYTYKKGAMGASEVARLARTFLGGGTNFTLALDKALNVINESRFKQADLVFVTDGEDQLTNSFLEAFNKRKREKAFNVLSLVIGCNRSTVEQFADRVIEVMDFDNEGSFTAFEI